MIYDICSMFFRLQNSQHQTTILRTTAKQTDFCISAQKTRINLKQTVGIKICNTKKEDAGFTFLGRIVGISEFTKKIINKGERRLNKLLPFWDQCEEAGRWEQLSTKLRMFNSKVKSVLQYQSGTWRETLITSIHGIYWGKQTPISQSKPWFDIESMEGKKDIWTRVLISDLMKIGKNVERQSPLYKTEGDRKSLLFSYEFQIWKIIFWYQKIYILNFLISKYLKISDTFTR